MKLILKNFKGKVVFCVCLYMAVLSQGLYAQPDTIRYLFMGHPRFDDREHEYVLPTVEKLDYSKFNLLLLGGDLTWNTSAATVTLEYCDSIFNLGSENTHLAMGNHDTDNLYNLLRYTKKERFYSFCRNKITFIIMDTEITQPNISGQQLEMIKAVADTIQYSDFLVLVQHRIIWMAGVPDLEYLKDSVAQSSRNISSSNFFTEVYPELQKVKSKGIPVYCIAGDRTDVNIEYSREDSIQFIASGMVGTFADEDNYAVLFTQIPEEHILNYEFVALSKLDTIENSSVSGEENLNITETDFLLFPNPCHGNLAIELSSTQKKDFLAELFTSYGAKIVEVTIPQNTGMSEIDLSFLAKGHYFIRIGNAQFSKTKQFVIIP